MTCVLVFPIFIMSSMIYFYHSNFPPVTAISDSNTTRTAHNTRSHLIKNCGRGYTVLPLFSALSPRLDLAWSKGKYPWYPLLEAWREGLWEHPAQHSTAQQHTEVHSVRDSVWDRLSLTDGNGSPFYLESLCCVMWLWSLLQVEDVYHFSWSCVFKLATWTLNQLSDPLVAYTAHINSLSRN